MILDLFEAASGSRMMCNYMRFGGVVADLPAGWVERARDLVWNRLPRVMDDFENLLTRQRDLRLRAAAGSAC